MEYLPIYNWLQDLLDNPTMEKVDEWGENWYAMPLSFAALTLGYPILLKLIAKGIDYPIDQIGSSYLGKKRNTLSLWDWILILTLFGIDDVGTAVGLNATENPISSMEGNPVPVAWIRGSIEKFSFVNSDMDAFRLLDVTVILSLIVGNYFELYGSSSRIILILVGALKTSIKQIVFLLV